MAYNGIRWNGSRILEADQGLPIFDQKNRKRYDLLHKIRFSNRSFYTFTIDWILGQALQDYPGVQVGANVHVSNLAYAETIVILSRSYSETQGLLVSVNRQAAAVRCTLTPRRPR